MFKKRSAVERLAVNVKCMRSMTEDDASSVGNLTKAKDMPSETS